jgi:hypothetical protein
MKVLTANRLKDGEAVWYTADRRWSESLGDAEVVHDKAGEDRLAASGQAAFKANLVLDVDLIDVELVDGRIVPIRLRERIRASGPTIREDVGKQARSGPADVAQAAGRISS